MDAIDKKHEHEPRQTGIGPGERLQAARIQQGLSLDDVANRMHLSLNILKAIEDNNFDEMTAPIFVKGYLRAYARIVSLNEDEMILQYLDFYSDEDPPLGSTSNILPELSSADARIKWTTYSVIIVIGVLLAAWWWNQEQSSEAPVSLDSPSREQRATADAEVISSEIEAVSEDVTTITATTDAESSQEESTPLPVIEPIAIPESPAAEPAVVEPAVVEPVIMEPVPLEPETQEPGPQSLETTPAARTEPVRLAPSGSDKLRINVSADTWTDVTDTNNYQLVYDLLRAGSSVELTGEAPFSVFLGNGHGVEIEFNGEAVDFSRRIRDDNTARLKIR